MPIQVYKGTIIYIFSPGNFASGGPEALHQLHYYFVNLGYNSRICYYGESLIQPKYLKYNPELVTLSEIIDSTDNIVIVPEIETKLLNHFKNVSKCVWFLGVQLYDGGYGTFTPTARRRLKAFLKYSLPTRFLKIRQNLIYRFNRSRYLSTPYVIDKKVHVLCGSKFAYDFAKARFKNVQFLIEPLGLPFLAPHAPNLTSTDRSDTVLFNPAKNSEIVNRLLKRNDLKLKPIEGFNEQELIELFRESKLYIDFGLFGGPERLPKETVSNGMTILVGKRNASVNNFDIAIPEKYKIEQIDDEEFIVTRIKEMLNNYDNIIADFEPFRNQINNLETNFIRSIKQIFIKQS